jgi:hypothetical protein
MNALKTLGRAFLDLFRPKILMLLLLPPVIAFILWGGIAYLYWDQILRLAQSYSDRFLFSGDIPPWIIQWLNLSASTVATALAASIALLLIIPLALVSSFALTGILAMPVVLLTVGKDYSNLEKRGKISFSASMRNLVISSLVYLILWALSLPLWIVPGLGFALPLILNGYLNYRLFTFDALADYASKAEIEALLKEHRLDFLILGVVISIPLLFPPFYFILPVYSALTFTRYSLFKLENFRLKQI